MSREPTIRARNNVARLWLSRGIRDYSHFLRERLAFRFRSLAYVLSDCVLLDSIAQQLINNS